MVYTYIGVSCSLIGVVALLWKQYDGAATDEARARHSQFLKTPFSATIAQWPSGFIYIFDWLYGKHAFSWRRAWVSVATSVMAVFILSWIWASQMPNTSSLLLSSWSSAATTRTALAILVFNLIPDYFSNLKTRFVMGKIGSTSSFWRQILWLLIDFIATLILIAMGSLAFVFFWLLLTNQQDFSLIAYLNSVLVHGWSLSAPVGIFLWSTFLTSAWALLYGLTVCVARLAMALASKWNALGSYLNVVNEPIKVMGLVSTVFMAALFLLGLLIILLC